VQKRQFVELKPSSGDSADDWLRLISDLEDTAGIKVERLDSGLIRIGWREFTDA
jgi:hypothetical protein